jgi:hypothetical protein
MPKKYVLLLVMAAALVLTIAIAACAGQPTAAPAPTVVPPTTAPPPPEPTAVPTEAPPQAAPNEPKPFTVFSAGMTNVPPGVPVYLRAGIAAPAEDAPEDAAPVAAISVVPMYPAMGDINPDNGRPVGIKYPRADSNPPSTEGVGDAPYAWTLVSAPEGSSAALAKEVAEVNGLGLDVASFVPDKEGEYVISLVVTDTEGVQTDAGEVTILATTYAGNEACKSCHADQYEKWAETPHGTAFERYVNTNTEAEYFTAGYACARCHTVGYYPVAESTGGWWEMLSSPDNWPTETIALNAFNEEEGQDTFHTAFSPEVQAVSGIGCESCHGPSAAHVAAPGPDSAPVTRADSSSCVQCHMASGHHTRGNAVANSAHAGNAELEEGSREDCARCHSPEGFVDTVVGEGEVRALNGNIGCATCHDPHSEENVFHLRAVDTAVVPLSPESASFTVEDAGLSASCMACHNGRRGAAIVEDETATRFTPHASTATEMLTGVGGYDWGYVLQDSSHVNIGKGVLNDEHTNQPGNMSLTQVHGGQAPGSCVLCHMYQTPGGVWDTLDSLSAPGHQTIGGHSFSMVTEEDGVQVEHVGPCQQCHPGVTTFDFPASGDYDGDGAVEGAQTEIDGLRELVQAAILNWKDASGKQITLSESGSFVTTDLKLTVDVKGAIFNYTFVGTAGAAHNFDRSVGLLQVSYLELAGKKVPNATLLYSQP